jgi:hypothetical protein
METLGVGEVLFPLFPVQDRAFCSLKLQVVDSAGDVLGESSFTFDVFAREEQMPESWHPQTELKPELLQRAREGQTVILGPLPQGWYDLDGDSFEIAPVGMGELTFCSRATGHPLVEGFAPNDFRLWFDEQEGCAGCMADSVIVGEGWTPILLSGRGGFGTEWIPSPVVAEKTVGAGRLIVCQLHMQDRLKSNPPAARFVQRLREYV